MKTIAVVPTLGDSTSTNVATAHTATMAGAETKDIFFAPSYKDFSDWGPGTWGPKYPGGSYRIWTRTAHTSSGYVNIANPSGAAITSAPAGGDQNAVPGVWVRVA